MDSKDFVAIIIILGVAVILPITAIFLSLRSKMAADKNRKDVVLAALEKNANIDIEEMIRKMNAPDKLLKEKLLKKLQMGLVTSFIGVGSLAFAACLALDENLHPKDSYLFCLIGAVLLAVGIAFILSYVVGKKLLAKEMEAEEKNLQQRSEK